MAWKHSTSAATVAMIGLLAFASAAPGASFEVVNLVTDNQAAHPAKITDPGLVNAWGLSHSATSPFWVSSNGAGTSTIYSVNPVTQATTKAGLVVTIPPGGGPVTGQVFNSNAASGAFNGDVFLFVSEDGTISGWRNPLTTAETLALASADNVYKGSAFATIAGNSYLYAANFRSGNVDVLKGSAGAPALAGNFVDPNLPAGYAPFNIQNLGGTLYVAYAQQDPASNDEQAGPGLGFVDSFTPQGLFIDRVASQGALNAPWGLALAPSSFGALAGALLVGNFGDGHISAYDVNTHAFQGQVTDGGGAALAIDGLWAIGTGNGGNGGSAALLYFTAGPDGESHGLFGVLTPVPEPATAWLWLTGLGLWASTRRRRSGVGTRRPIAALAPWLASIAMLASGPAPAAQVAQVLNQFNFVGNHGIDGQVSSTLDCGFASCGVYDSLEFFGVDGAVNLVWTRADGSVLLSGQVPWDFTLGGANTSIGRTSSRQYVGFLAGKPSYSQLTGKADFSQSVTINPPCFGFVCKQDYLELPIVMPNLFLKQAAVAGAAPRGVAPAADAGAQLGTTWTLSDLQVPAGSPYGTEPTAVDVFSFGSVVEKVGSDYHYRYTVTNPSNDPIDFSFDHFAWAGKLDQQGMSSYEVVSSLPPALASNTGNADLGSGRLFAGRLDILQPVPEPQSGVLLGVGLGCVTLVLRRRTHLRATRASEPAVRPAPQAGKFAGLRPAAVASEAPPLAMPA